MFVKIELNKYFVIHLMKLKLFLTLLFSLIFISECINIQLYSDKLVINKYNCIKKDVDTRMAISINNAVFRESVIGCSQQGLFPIKLRAGNYTIVPKFYFNNSNVFHNHQIQKKEGNIHYAKNLFKNIKIIPGYQELANIHFNLVKKKEIMVISNSILALQKENLHFKYNIDIIKNGNNIYHLKSLQQFFSFNKLFTWDKGMYQIVLSIDYNSNILACSCPTIKNGYQYIRFLSLIEKDLESNEIKLVVNIAQKEKIQTVVSISEKLGNKFINMLPQQIEPNLLSWIKMIK